MKHQYFQEAGEEAAGAGGEAPAADPVVAGNLVEQLQGQAEQAAAAKNAAPPSGDWKWNDELPGSGDAPDWFKGAKYGSIAEQAKAYTELESKFGGFSGAPEEYEVALPEDIVLPEGVEWELQPDDPLIAAIAPVAKELNMSQDAFNKLIKSYVEYEAGEVKAEMDGEQGRQTTELASIPQGVERVGNVAAWLKANVPDEDYDTLTGTLTDAKTLTAMENLIRQTRGSKLPDPSEVQGAAAYTKAEIAEMYKAKDENGRPRVETDKSYRESLQKKLAQAHG